MHQARPFTRTIVLLLGLGALLTAAVAATALYAVTPATENPRSALDLAFARLHTSSSYRIRETIVRPVDAGGGVGVILTEIAGSRRRQVLELDAPGLGVVRIESVRDGAQAAMRADVPAFRALASADPTHLSLAESRRLFRRVIGLSLEGRLDAPVSADLVSLSRNGAAARTPSELDATFAAVRSRLGTWQRCDRPPAPLGDEQFRIADQVKLIGIGEHPRYGRVALYRQPAHVAGAEGHTRTVLVDQTTGLPVAEEIADGDGRLVRRVEYADIGADVTIELPACLRESLATLRSGTRERKSTVSRDLRRDLALVGRTSGGNARISPRRS